MDVAIVTGAASGVGLAISRQLVELGCRVYGLGGNYKDLSYTHDYFIPMPCDLTSVEDIGDKVKQILEKEDNIYVVVNNAKFYPRTAFAEARLFELEASVRINLLAPMVLTRMALPSLKNLQGFVINIAANSPEDTRGGVAGAVSSGGLHWMGEALFEEMRDHGVKVCTVYPKTNRYRPDNAGKPGHGSLPQTTIDPEAVGEAVRRIVSQRDGNVVTEIVIRPQRVTENGLPAVVDLPFPKADKEAIYREVEDIRERSKHEEQRRVEDRKKREVERKERETKAAEEVRRKEERRKDEARRKEEEKKRREEAFRRQEEAVREAEREMLEKERARKEGRHAKVQDEDIEHGDEVDLPEEAESSDATPDQQEQREEEAPRGRNRRGRNRRRGRGRQREGDEQDTARNDPPSTEDAPADKQEQPPRREEQQVPVASPQEEVAREVEASKPRRNRRNRGRSTPATPAVSQDYLSKYTPPAVSDRRKKPGSAAEGSSSPKGGDERKQEVKAKEGEPIPKANEAAVEQRASSSQAPVATDVTPATEKAGETRSTTEKGTAKKTAKKKTVAKKVAKKVATKKTTAKKNVAKKTATKKVARKTATKKTARKKTTEESSE